ncbi:MAG: antibiotic biosynthesis monooxygenase family protein [Polaribacter sp.]
MILEIATLNIKKGLSEDFEINFQKAEKIILSMKGYISNQLKKILHKKINIFY